MKIETTPVRTAAPVPAASSPPPAKPVPPPVTPIPPAPTPTTDTSVVTPRPQGFSPTVADTDWGATVRSGPLPPGMGIGPDPSGRPGPVKDTVPAPPPPPGPRAVPTKPGLIRPEGDGAAIGKHVHATSGGLSVFHKVVPSKQGHPPTTVDVTVSPPKGTGMPLHLQDEKGVLLDPRSVETIDAGNAPKVTGTNFEVRF